MSEGTFFIQCDDRFSPSDQPWCEDFFQLLRLIPIQGFEQRSERKSARKFAKYLRKPQTDRLYIAEATPEHLAAAVRCGLLGSVDEKIALSGGAAAFANAQAENIANLLWQDYQNAYMRRCDALKIPLVCRDIELALVIRYRQCWKPHGYWRGELLNSLSLAPGEELTLEFFTWDRHKIERERSAEVSAESSESGSLTSRSSNEVVTSAEFRVRAGAEGKIGASLPLKETSIPIDAEGSIGGNFETEFSGSVTATQNRLNEATRTVSNTLRASRKTRVVETAELGSETRSTRRIKNENRCHTVNYDYFEVLEQYQVSVETVGIEFVALVPLPPLGEMDAAWVLCHEHPLRAHLLHRVFERGFEAARLLRSAEILQERLTPPSSAPIVSTPPESDDSSTTTPADPLGDHLRIFIAAIIKAADRLEQASASASDYANLFHWNETIRNAAFRRISKVSTRSFILSVFASLFERIDDLESVQNAIGTELAAHLEVFKTQVAETGLLNTVAQPIKLEAFPLLIFDFEDEGLIGAIDAAILQLDNLGPALTVQTGAESLLPPGPTSEDGAGGSPVEQVFSLSAVDQILDDRYGLDTLSEAKVELERLLCHLREHINYYQTLLFTHRGAKAIDELLAACPQVALMVERRVIGVQNGYAVFPLRPSLQREKQSEIVNLIERLEEENREANTFTVMLPTAGTVLEARLGECNACEPFVREHRAEDIKLRRAEVALAEAEAEKAAETARRYRLRLDAAPPLLDDPESDAAALRVQLEQVSQDGGGDE